MVIFCDLKLSEKLFKICQKRKKNLLDINKTYIRILFLT